ncbi:IpaD/SipD/SspD family type III secretion system needle tip protein [Pseudomonas sp. MYb118]|uniref:IpaD/SipD/SspD family type III secretion system needle tip protein n=1 Tax=Pseudomonas sp. MYb118 TaxID=1848720 RepID=UPI0034CD5ADC
MRIGDFTPPANVSNADSNRATEPPQAPEPRSTRVDRPLVQLLDRSNNGMGRHLQNLLKVQPSAEKVTERLLAGAAPEGVMAEFDEQVQTRQVRAQMWTQQLNQSGALMAHVQDTLPVQQRQGLIAAQHSVLTDLPQDLPPPGEIAGAFDQASRSSNDFFDKLRDLIDLIKNGYLAGYQHIIDRFTQFFADFNQQITAKLKDWIKGVNDGKEVELDAAKLGFALRSLRDKYSHPKPAAVLYPAPGMEPASKEQADKWRVALGLPPESLKRNANGSFSVVMDLGPLNTMINQLPSTAQKWDTARFQSWQTGFNAQEERLKNMLQSFTQKYSNANAYHDNFNKILSSHLSQYADMLRAMLNF